MSSLSIFRTRIGHIFAARGPTGLGLIASVAFSAFLFSTSAQATYFGASGYLAAAHVGNGCLAILVTPSYTSDTGGVWFSVDISSTSPLTPQAAAAQVGMLLAQQANTNDAILFKITPGKIGFDYDPAQTATCLIDAEGDGSISTIRATNFNLPPAPSQ